MGTTAEKLNYLMDTKTAIKNALVAKGVSVADSDTFRSYADKIGEIQSGGGSQIEYWKKGDGTHAISGVMAMYCPIVKVTADDTTQIAPGAIWVANPTATILAVAFDRTYKFLMDGDIVTLGEILPDLGWDDSFFVQIKEEEFYSAE